MSTKDDFFAWLQTHAGIEDEKIRLDIMAKAEEVYGIDYRPRPGQVYVPPVKPTTLNPPW